MALFDKVLGRDERERSLQKEIHSLKLRRESVFSAIDAEIAKLRGERSNVLLTAGEAAYEAWCQDNAQVDLTEYWSKVKGLEKQVQEQQEKRTEMGVKYDEEIRLINSNLNMNTVNAAPGGGIVCPKCGKQATSEDTFCQNCGARLH